MTMSELRQIASVTVNLEVFTPKFRGLLDSESNENLTPAILQR